MTNKDALGIYDRIVDFIENVVTKHSGSWHINDFASKKEFETIRQALQEKQADNRAAGMDNEENNMMVPSEIWVVEAYPNATEGQWDEDYGIMAGANPTKYVRTDIHEATRKKMLHHIEESERLDNEKQDLVKERDELRKALRHHETIVKSLSLTRQQMIDEIELSAQQALKGGK